MALQPDFSGAKEHPIVLESLKTRSENILKGMEKLPIMSGIKSLPDLSKWLEFDDARKLQAMREMLSGELYQIQSRYCDDRNAPTQASNRLKNKYHAFVVPWMGQYYREFGKEKFDEMTMKGQIDPMVKELRERGLLKPGLDPKSEVLSIAASTGSTQYLWQYDQGLQMLEQMREKVGKATNWTEARKGLEEIQVEQTQRLKSALGLPRDGVLVRMQSGSDLPILNALWGSKATQITNETGTASWAAASFRHTAPDGPMGHKRRMDKDDKMPKLVGFENTEDAVELPLRNESGEGFTSNEIRDSTELWIRKMREKHLGCKLTIGVTAGGKTGLGWDVGGLTIQDAYALRQIYGGGDKLKTDIQIVVDNSQGRLDRHDIFELTKNRVSIDFTGSKVFEGPMFSAFRYIPKEYVDSIRENVRANLVNPDYLKGLAEYVTQSDLKELIGDELMIEVGMRIPDLPDLVSVLKWETPLVTLEKFEPKTQQEQVDSQRLVWDFMKQLQTDFLKIAENPILGHNLNFKFLNELNKYSQNPKVNLLSSIQIEIDGKILKERDLRAIHKAMAEPGRSGRMVNIGQYVAGVNVLRPAPGFMTEIGLRDAEIIATYISDLSESITGKMREVVEELVRSKRQSYDARYDWTESQRSDWEDKQSRFAYDKMEKISKIKSVVKKVNKIISYFKNTFADTSLMPVALVSGKKVASLAIMYKTWEASKRDEDMPVAFIDHPYVLVGQGGESIPPSESVYSVMCKSLKDFPKTHLYIYGAGEEIKNQLTLNEINPSRYTVCLPMADKTSFEVVKPEWYKNIYEVDREQASLINERHKGLPTDLMLYDMRNRFPYKTIMIGRGLMRDQQQGREGTLPLSVSDDLDFLGLHLLTALTSEEVNRWLEIKHLVSRVKYVDWLKEVQKSCGLDLRFKMVIPKWYTEIKKHKELKGR